MKYQSPFNIRVYAIIIKDKKELLLSDEYQFDTQITKLPGGGLEFGEGTIECLQREAIEEMGQEIEVLEHFYTTDFFQPGLSDPEMQVVCVYYFARLLEAPTFRLQETPFQYVEAVNESLAFRWIALDQLSENTMSLPTDKMLVRKLKIFDFYR